ncbi:hypothetical protein B4135_0168 [Caldibacillus debilis]|uniref:Uncharacterized protein n=1 Tax=Caldibacillus debilis TaxID=301148 RepID=A0A150LWD8_9BACI|nr:hypothetical protein B4135_0168 [Caldibacillus debilis]
MEKGKPGAGRPLAGLPNLRQRSAPDLSPMNAYEAGIRGSRFPDPVFL